MKELIDRLEAGQELSKEEYASLISGFDSQLSEYLFEKSRRLRQKFYRKDVYIRGLIEFTNYCKNDCLYCGIRRSNKNAERYRLSKDDIMLCCHEGYDLGFRTFVLQGGEDTYYTDDKVADIISSIKTDFPH